jgi:hypothetical protein
MCKRSFGAVVLAASLVPAVRAEEPKKAPADKPPTFTVPKGWEEQEPDKFGIAVARFRIGNGKGTEGVAVAVSKLAGDGGGLVANVNRWRAQVGSQALDEKDALAALESIKVDGTDGHLLDVTGPEVEGKGTQRVLAVAVSRGEVTWFVRIGGPAKAVGEQKKAFDEFVKSIRFAK